LVIASHSTELIRKMCNRALLLEHGNMTAYGDVTEVIDVYERRVREQKSLEANAAAKTGHAASRLSPCCAAEASPLANDRRGRGW
jgi:ABC-type glutathione transport system ATPase component